MTISKKDLFSFYNGNNKLNSLNMFNSRKNYANFAYPVNPGFAPFDIWADRPYYGKVDRNGKPVFISESNLKQINIGGPIIMVADFVADAFEDFLNYYRKLQLRKKLDKNSSLYELKPKKGWRSIGNDHHSYVSLVYDTFILLFLRLNNRDKEIKTFEDFLNMFRLFFHNAKGSITFTRSAFITSSNCSCLTSGLMVELGNDDYSMDAVKKSKYIEDINFPAFQIAARKFGFKIDKNVPWRMIANVASPRMQKYMQKYGVNYVPGSASDLFDLYHYRAEDKDLEILKTYLMHFYNSYCDAYPTVRKIDICSSGKTTHTHSFTRQKIDANYVSTHFNDDFWIEYYFYLRSKEENINWDNSQYQVKAKKAIEIQKRLDIRSSMDYIQIEVNNNK